MYEFLLEIVNPERTEKCIGLTILGFFFMYVPAIQVRMGTLKVSCLKVWDGKFHFVGTLKRSLFDFHNSFPVGKKK